MDYFLVRSLGNSVATLKGLVSDIRQGIPLPLTPEFERLLGQAVQVSGVPANIKDWARKLSQCVGHIDD